MELREEFSVCLNNETLSRVRVYLYKPFYSRERENAKLRGTRLSESRELLVLHGTSCSGEHMSLRIIEYKTSRAGIVIR